MTNLKRKARSWDRLQAEVVKGSVNVVDSFSANGIKYRGLSGYEEYRLREHIRTIEARLIDADKRDRVAVAHMADFMRMKP